MLLAACSAGPNGRRRDALWTEYRRGVRAADEHRDDANLFAETKELDRGALIASVLARNPDIDAAREGLRAALARAGEKVDRYTRELHQLGLDTTEREVRWLNELIAHERAAHRRCELV